MGLSKVLSPYWKKRTRSSVLRFRYLRFGAYCADLYISSVLLTKRSMMSRVKKIPRVIMEGSRGVSARARGRTSISRSGAIGRPFLRAGYPERTCASVRLPDRNASWWSLVRCTHLLRLASYCIFLELFRKCVGCACCGRFCMARSIEILPRLLVMKTSVKHKYVGDVLCHHRNICFLSQKCLCQDSATASAYGPSYQCIINKRRTPHPTIQ